MIGNAATDRTPEMMFDRPVEAAEFALGDSVMDEKRNASRQRVLKGAFIVITEKQPKIECTVRNISDTGCAVQVLTTIGIPQKFDLIVGDVRRHCHVQWKAGTKIGVKFE
jgi:hypothetical protein